MDWYQRLCMVTGRKKFNEKASSDFGWQVVVYSVVTETAGHAYKCKIVWAPTVWGWVSRGIILCDGVRWNLKKKSCWYANLCLWNRRNLVSGSYLLWKIDEKKNISVSLFSDHFVIFMSNSKLENTTNLNELIHLKFQGTCNPCRSCNATAADQTICQSHSGPLTYENSSVSSCLPITLNIPTFWSIL